MVGSINAAVLVEAAPGAVVQVPCGGLVSVRRGSGGRMLLCIRSAGEVEVIALPDAAVIDRTGVEPCGV